MLPITMLTLALASHVYGPHEFRVGLRRNHVVNDQGYYGQHYPVLIQRISEGISFPALTLSYPFREEYDPILYQRNSDWGYVSVDPRDIAFFVGIILFWYWIGRHLDKVHNRAASWPRKARILGFVCGVLFGLLTGLYAGRMIGTKLPPEVQIGAFGIAWAVGLVAYFTWQLTGELRREQQRAPSTPRDGGTTHR